MAENWRDRAKRKGFEPAPMRLTTELADVTELADGSFIEVDDVTLVPMGDVFVHRQITYTRAATVTRPECKVAFEVRAGVPVCVSLQIGSPEIPVRAKHLTAIRLEDLRDDAYAAAGVFVPNPDGGYVRKLGFNFHQDRKAQQAVQPRKLTPDFLARVAKIHNAAPHGSRIEAVRSAFTPTKDKRTVLRWIAAARKEGLINE